MEPGTSGLRETQQSCVSPKFFKKKNRRGTKKKNVPSPVTNSYTVEEASGSGTSQQKKRVRVRRRPNLKQFLIENNDLGESSQQKLDDTKKVVFDTSNMHSVIQNFANIKDDILSLQSLYFQMNKLSVVNHSTNTNVNSSPANQTMNEKIDKKKKETKSDKVYENYLPKQDVLEGLKNGTLLEGSLRINPKFFHQAYVSHPDKKQSDIIINGVRNRNRALEDDVVVISLKESEEEEDSKLYGKVVYIKEHVHSHISTGTLKLAEKSEKQPGATFYPRDKKFPNLFIPLIDCPQHFQLEHKKYENALFSARIIKWVHPKHTVGTILSHIGQSSDLKAQTQAILIENELNFTPYGTEFQHLYPGGDFVIPDEEILKREDFRNICVFTIDPATARDLDDAVSCKKLDNGNFEIGVHISDVTYYLDEDTALDKEVSKRATTVYLVDGTYHMLPKDLCLHCSLLPGTDKLTFSIVWELTPEGNIVNHRFTRGVINSCCQLAYEHVQYIIENPNEPLVEQDYPNILGQWNLEDIKDIVNILHKLAVQFRTKRFKGGALRIDQPKLWFKLDPANGNPLTFKIEEHNESHRLIEEFMLLANCTVAERIFEDFPQLAFLRLHPPPKNTIDSVVENFSRLGIDLDISSAGGLHSSLAKHLADDNKSKVFVLQAHLIKTLSRAKYFCANGYDDDEIRHYALNIPLYTHFTSPIRRYADIVVHRLLAATLGYTPRPKWTSDTVQKIADNCNKQKYNAKKANDMSCELYLFKYISIYSPVHEKAAIMDIFDNSFDVIIFSTGFIRRIYFDNFSSVEAQVDVVKGVDIPHKVVVKWKLDPQIIQVYSVFDEINVVLEKTDNILVITTKVAVPTQS